VFIAHRRNENASITPVTAFTRDVVTMMSDDHTTSIYEHKQATSNWLLPSCLVLLFVDDDDNAEEFFIHRLDAGKRLLWGCNLRWSSDFAFEVEKEGPRKGLFSRP
jgi:hypothetical protein